MKPGAVLAIASITLASGLTGCDCSSHKSPVSTWDEGGGPDEVYRIEQVLRPGDGIAVNMEEKLPFRMELGPLTIITTGLNDPIGFSVRDHWLDPDAGDQMLDLANEQHVDRARRVVFLIKEIHHWQDTHPRPGTAAAAPQSAPVAKAEAPPTPAPSQPILGPFMHWVSIITSVALATGALFLLAIFSQFSYHELRDSRARHRRDAEVANAKHLAELAAIAARAEHENEDYTRGDRERGIYGNYPPSS